MPSTYEVEVYPLNSTGEVEALTEYLRSQGIRHTVEPSGEHSRLTFQIDRDTSEGGVAREINEWLLGLHVSTTAGPDGLVSRPFTVRERHLSAAGLPS